MGKTITNKSNLKSYINADGLPIMDTESFVEMTNSIGKEQFRLDLAEYIANNRPKYPFKKISLDDISKLFTSLKEKDIWDYLTPKENLKKLVKIYDSKEIAIQWEKLLKREFKKF